MGGADRGSSLVKVCESQFLTVDRPVVGENVFKKSYKHIRSHRPLLPFENDF